MQGLTYKDGVAVQVLNENDSPLLNDTLAALNLNETAGMSADDFAESNKKHSINGLLFCNARNFSITLGTKCGPLPSPTWSFGSSRSV